jgi:hypothetical protein
MAQRSGVVVLAGTLVNHQWLKARSKSCIVFARFGVLMASQMTGSAIPITRDNLEVFRHERGRLAPQFVQ